MIQGVFVNSCFLKCLISHCDVSQFFPHGNNVNSTFRKTFPLDALQFPFLFLFLCSALSSPHPITSSYPTTSQPWASYPRPWPLIPISLFLHIFKHRLHRVILSVYHSASFSGTSGGGKHQCLINHGSQ